MSRNGNICYHRAMRRKLTSEQIRSTCFAVLERSRSATVREVEVELQSIYGASGRRERVNNILHSAKLQWKAEAATADDWDITSLRRQLLDAQRRAERAEALERSHQDFWAARYAEKLVSLESRVQPVRPTGVSSEQYLRLYRRAAELWNRLARYEEVGPLLPASDLRSER
jgi:hypothetical protein